MAAVLVQVASDVRAKDAAALVEACTRAVRAPGGCALTTDEGTKQPVAVAVISFEGPQRLQAHIQISLIASQPLRFRSNDLHFSDGDDGVERFRSIGFSIGVLVGEALLDQDHPEPAKERAEVQTRRAPPIATAPSPSRLVALPAWFVNAEVALGTGATANLAEPRGMLGVSRRVASSPLLACLEFEYAAQPLEKGASLRAVSGFLGIAWMTAFATSWGLETKFEAVAQRLEIRGVDPSSGAAGGVSSWRVALRQTGAVSLALSAPTALVLGVALSEAPSPVNISLRQQRIGHISAINPAMLFGIRMSL